jgi:hypothetical protein
MTKRTIFIRDIHMSIDADTNWWQHTVHKKALKGKEKGGRQEFPLATDERKKGAGKNFH